MTIATRFPKSWAVAGFDIKDPSLVLYLPLWYPYSDMTGSTIYSYGRNRLSGTVTGATWGSQGRDFDGSDDNLNLGQSTTLDPGTGGFSIEAWVNTDTIAAGLGRIVSKQGAAWYFLRRSAATWAISWKDSAANTLTVTSTAGMAVVGKWIHLLVVRDGINGYLYIDGLLNASGSTVGLDNINPGAANCYIGTYDQISEGFDGKIGEVRVYNRALSVGEILRNYQVTKWRYQ